MLFRKKKTAPEAVTYPYGFQIPDQPQTVCSYRGLACLMKGLLIFAAAYGTVGGVISSFQLPCYSGLLFLIILALSILLAFLHYSRKLFNIFYPVIFVAFTYFIITFRYMVNSGYQAFVNILQQTYGDYYLLSTYRESGEYFADRAMTITYAAAFIGFFLVLLLNIFISEYMSLVGVILLTFPLFQLGIYVERLPSMFCFVLLLFSYFMVGILRCSRHFLLPYRDKKWTEFKQKQKNHVISYRYHASGKLFWQLALLFFCFALSIGLITLPLMSNSSNNRLSQARRNLDDYVQVLTQNGLQGFFNRYAAKGGISGGQLGGVSSVRPDYQTDLNVTFVPYSYNTLYLKAYTGTVYTGTSWDPLPKQVTETGTPAVLPQGIDLQLPTAKMQIENLDAEKGYYYLPYYTGDDLGLDYTVVSDTVYPDSTAEDIYSYTYHPLTMSTEEIAGLPQKDPSVSLENPDTYLALSDSLASYLATLHDEIGAAGDAAGQAEKIYEYFRENFSYTQTPGTTPMKEDFARYFLENQKRGYCAHFATAGALLMRSFGYPARYVEGYSVSLSAVAEGTEEAGLKYEDWFDGDNPLGQTGVVTVPVTDGSAHAWVEVFIDGFGWVPCEFTPPSDGSEDTEAVSGFWQIFTSLFSPTGSQPETIEPSELTNNLNEASDRASRFLGNSVFRPLIILLCGLLILWIVQFMIRRILFYGKMYLSFRNGDHRPLIGYRYRQLTSALQKKGLIEPGATFILPTDLAELHRNRIYGSLPASLKDKIPEDITRFTELVEKCLYSEKDIDHSEADVLSTFLKQYKKLRG